MPTPRQPAFPTYPVTQKHTVLSVPSRQGSPERTFHEVHYEVYQARKQGCSKAVASPFTRQGYSLTVKRQGWSLTVQASRL